MRRCEGQLEYDRKSMNGRQRDRLINRGVGTEHETGRGLAEMVDKEGIDSKMIAEREYETERQTENGGKRHFLFGWSRKAI